MRAYVCAHAYMCLCVGGGGCGGVFLGFFGFFFKSHQYFSYSCRYSLSAHCIKKSSSCLLQLSLLL